MAETPDHDWARDEAILWRDYVELSRDEARLDSEFAEAVRAWDSRDDSTYLAAMAVEDAEGAVWDAVEAAGGEFESKGDFHDTKQAIDVEILESFHEIQGRYVGEAYRFYHDGKPEVRSTRDATARREWSSRKFTMSASVPSPRRQWVTSHCQHSFGSFASKRTHELRGRLWGWGTTNPRRRSTRQIVETDGTCVRRSPRW